MLYAFYAPRKSMIGDCHFPLLLLCFVFIPTVYYPIAPIDSQNICASFMFLVEFQCPIFH